MSVLRAVSVSVVVLVLSAGPAGASTSLLATERYKWFWWIAPILALSCLAVGGKLVADYVRKIVIPRRRGRRVE